MRARNLHFCGQLRAPNIGPNSAASCHDIMVSTSAFIHPRCQGGRGGAYPRKLTITVPHYIFIYLPTENIPPLEINSLLQHHVWVRAYIHPCALVLKLSCARETERILAPVVISLTWHGYLQRQRRNPRNVVRYAQAGIATVRSSTVDRKRKVKLIHELDY